MSFRITTDRTNTNARLGLQKISVLQGRSLRGIVNSDNTVTTTPHHGDEFKCREGIEKLRDPFITTDSHKAGTRLGSVVRAIFRSSSEREEFRSAIKEIRKLIASGLGEDAATRFDDQFASPWRQFFGSPLTRGALIKFLEILFSDDGTKIPRLGSYKVENGKMDSFLKDLLEKSQKRVEEESETSFNTDVTRGIDLSYKKETTHCIDIPEDISDVCKNSDRAIKGREILSLISENIFPNRDGKAEILKKYLISISNQSLPTIIGHVFNKAEANQPGIFVNAGLQPGAVFKYSVQKNDDSNPQIKITISGRLKNKQNSISIIKDAKTLSSEEHEAEGTLSLDLLATVDPKTGKITALHCESAGGTWDIAPKAANQ